MNHKIAAYFTAAILCFALPCPAYGNGEATDQETEKAPNPEPPKTEAKEIHKKATSEAKETAEPKDTKKFVKEETSVTTGSVTINGVTVDYKATAGNMALKDEKGDGKASIFYISYVREGVADNAQRPITFCFNGGPGSASIWLHIGVFGPRIVSLSEDGYALPPYHLISNEYSILDVTDLVFIDPVSTGYSKAAPGEDVKQFHGFSEDIQWVAEFVRLYTTRNNRWDSPKFLAGESYGTTRAAGLAGYLHDTMRFYTNGVILISSILNFQTVFDDQRGNDLPYLLALPSLTATAHYHKKLPEELQKKTLAEVTAEAEAFANTEYNLALMRGDLLVDKEREEILKKLSYYTGLSESYIALNDLRVPLLRFSKELLRDKRRTVGRFDSRYIGIDGDASGDTIESDPSINAIIGAFAASFNHYVRTDLKWEKDEQYKILANVQPWNFGNAQNEYLNVGETLRSVMTHNPSLRVFVGSGYYDLAIPFYSSDYTFSHLRLDPTLRPHVTMAYYDAGHMMYTHQPSLIKMKKDISEFITNTLKEEHPPGAKPVNGSPQDAF